MEFKSLVKKYQDDLIKTLQSLVQINSILDESTKTIDMPFGKGINDALTFMEQLAKKDGFEVFNDEGYLLNVKLSGKTNETIAVLGHLDTVPVDNDWSHDPFGAEIVDGKMYGRGTTDDKGPVLAAYFALKILKDEKIPLTKGVELLLGTDEETGWRGVGHYMMNHEIPAFGFSPDAEWPLINGEKGILRINLEGLASNDFTLTGGKVVNAVIGEAKATTKVDLIKEFEDYLNENKLNGDAYLKDGSYHYTLLGRTAHAMNPEIGINAGLHMARFLNEHFDHPTLKFLTNCIFDDFNMNKLGMRVEHEVMGLGTLNVGIMRLNSEKSFFTFDIRFPKGFEFNEFEDAFKNILACYNLKYQVLENKGVHYVEPTEKLVQTLMASYIKYTNDVNAYPRSIGGGTYAKILKQGVAFGLEDPNKPSVCHISDEYIEIDELIKATCIYLDAIYELCK